MLKLDVYQGVTRIGEGVIHPVNQKFDAIGVQCKGGIRISRFSTTSERCPPLAILHTIAASSGVCFKMESNIQETGESTLFHLHASCLKDNKTAIMQIGEEELHLVAMTPRNKVERCSCFWGYIVRAGLYSACMNMLNLRCLGIVFDLDETLIVANTMRSFEDRIDALLRKMGTESDPQRVAGMAAEIKRFQEDKSILKQYIENDQVVVENGSVIKVQMEMVPPISESHQSIVRPLIRLHDKNIILTRINPTIRDTSVLVQLRPAWDDLRSYLTARGRKRFEVYVCTMAERDYALEMWRLLDPEMSLISSKELLDRIVCVKSGSRKSLLNVFQDGICHPRMAMIIDDRLKVWDDRDQPRVHVVPAFAPYYAPQAEANSAIPVLCVARSVACDVRGGFFRDFDDGLLQQIYSVLYEDDVANLTSVPDVSNYLNLEDDPSPSNGSKEALIQEVNTDIEVGRRSKDVNVYGQATPVSAPSNTGPSSASTLPYALAANLNPQQPSQTSLPVNQLSHVTASQNVSSAIPPPDSSMQSSPGREEGEVPESELDPDTRRRMLILQHGQDMREQAPVDPPAQLQNPVATTGRPTQPQMAWPGTGDELSRQLSRPYRDFQQDVFPPGSHNISFYQGVENSAPADKSFVEPQRIPREVHYGDDQPRLSRPLPASSFVPDGPYGSVPTILNRKDGQLFSMNSSSPLMVLQEIALKCGEKVDFRSLLQDTLELQFSVEAWFVGEKIGEGTGKTRREAKLFAAGDSLRKLASRYLSSFSMGPRALHGDVNKDPRLNDNGFPNDGNNWYGNLAFSRDNPQLPATDFSRSMDQKQAIYLRPTAPVNSLKELCMMEGLSLYFQEQASVPADSIDSGKVYAQAEVGGRVLGKGMGSSWEEAKQQAAEEALISWNSSSFAQRTRKQSTSPRASHGTPSKRIKPEFPRAVSRMPPSTYPKNGPPVS